MKKENLITYTALALLVAGLLFAIFSLGHPSGKIIKNLTEPQNVANNQNSIITMTPQPGDEKLAKKDIVIGNGGEVKIGDLVSVHYTGAFLDGRKFDSSLDRKTPFEFTIGAGNVIRGWDLGLVGMKVGGTRELTVPPELAYGKDGYGPIPPDSTLKFTIELLEIKADPGQIPLQL